MSLSDKQWEFLRDVAKLVLYAEERGYKLTGGELERTKEQQALYVEQKKSNTFKSDHLQRLAIDLNIFWEGKYLGSYPKVTQHIIVKPLVEFWHSLHPDNYCGADWGWDLPHFGRKA